jgi:hypothetical protein
MFIIVDYFYEIFLDMGRFLYYTRGMKRPRTIKEIKLHITNKLKFNPKKGCLEWQGHCGKIHGYGGITFNTRDCLVHRVMWELVNGPIPELFEGEPAFILHRCDNRPCCNPSHLFLGNNTINMQDMVDKGRLVLGDRKGEMSRCCKTTDKEVLEIRAQWETGCYTQQELGIEHNMARSNIGRIVNRISWKHI